MAKRSRPNAPPTLRTIAERVGCSVAVASTVLNRSKGRTNCSDALRTKIQNMAQSLGYQPNHAARAMRSRRTGQVGILIHNNPEDRFYHPLLFEFILGINEGLQDAGYALVLLRPTELREDDPAAAALLAFRERMLDGLMVLGRIEDRVRDAAESHFPSIFWLDSTVWRAQNCLRRNERQAGEIAARQLLDAGCRRLLWIGSETPQKHFSEIERLAGVGAVAAKRKVDVEVLAFPFQRFTVQEETFARLRQVAAPDTGVILGDAYRATRFAHFAAAAGGAVHRHWMLACCDDSQQFDRMWPELSRVSFPRFDMGRTAAKRFCDMLRKGNSTCPSETVGVEWIPGRLPVYLPVPPKGESR